MWCTRSFALGTGQYKFSFVIVKINKSTSNANRIPMRLSVGSQTLAASPVTIEWDFFAVSPSLSQVGTAFFKNETYPSSVPEVYYKPDTTNKKCYVTVSFTNQSAMWGTAVLEWFYSPELVDFGISVDGTIDVSADAEATKMKLYAPAMTLLS